MSKTTFVDGNPSQGIQGTVVTAAFLNAVNNHRHKGQAVDGDGALDYAADTGAANAYVVALSPALDAYITGMPVHFKAANANTGASTININGLGVKTIKKNGSADLIPGDIAAGQIVVVVYDGINFQLVSNAVSSVPAGTVTAFAANTPPDGFLKANGAAVSRTTYAALFSAIGTTFGVGDGSTTFNVPDLRGEFIRGWDDSRGVDSGRTFGSAQADAMQGHWHPIWGCQQMATGGSSYGFSTGGTLGPVNDAVKSPIADGVNGTPRTAAETRPRNIALLACIKY